MSQDDRNRVCPVELADGLDSRIRKFLQNPRKILNPYIKNGMTVFDIGCGPGVFSIEMAKMVGVSGHVIAADLQEGMLRKLEEKIAGTTMEKIIELHKCESDKIGVLSKADLILAFYMIHEVPDKVNFFKEVKQLLKPDGKLLIVEPKMHVSKREFDEMLTSLIDMGFDVVERPKIFFSRSVLLK
jgi:ubiquinone/menaquinone biosynthesis C-methylase UbiE